MAGTAEVAFGSEPVSFKTAASSIVITPPVFPSDPRFLRRPSLDSASSTTTTNSKGVSSVFPPGSPFLERLVESDDGSPSEPLLEADQAQQELLQLELNDFPNVQVHGVLAALDASNPSVDKLEMIKALPVSTSVKEVVQEIVNRIAELELFVEANSWLLDQNTDSVK
ncbi:hypothetical protein BC828DRAFT_430955 [Blastocladiella britannica]|nr:hypothetical protein BC828DRAFT_430955 [Blastocladiella britannica]